MVQQLTIRNLPLGDLKPAKYNPRKDLKPGDPEWDKLARSISEFGLVEPLVWNERTGNLVGGHQRLKVLKSQGIETVPVAVVDLELEQEKALNVALNKIAGDWEPTPLADLLSELSNNGLLEVTGFEEAELEALIDELTPRSLDDLVDPEIDEVNVESVTKLGDVWQLGDHRLICGDCTDASVMAQVMQEQRAAVAFADPPYNVGYEYADTDDNRSEDDYRDFCQQWFAVLQGVSEKQIVTPGPMNLSQWIKQGAIHAIGIWQKVNGHGGSKIAMFTRWEPLLFLGERWRRGREGDVFSYATERTNEVEDHTCPKPLKLLGDLVESYSKPRDLWVDPFLGSGTTLIACEQLGRKCYGIELSPHYCDLIVRRWETLTGRKAERVTDGQTDQADT